MLFHGLKKSKLYDVLVHNLIQLKLFFWNDFFFILLFSSRKCQVKYLFCIEPIFFYFLWSPALVISRNQSVIIYKMDIRALGYVFALLRYRKLIILLLREYQMSTTITRGSSTMLPALWTFLFGPSILYSWDLSFFLLWKYWDLFFQWSTLFLWLDQYN